MKREGCLRDSFRRRSDDDGDDNDIMTPRMKRKVVERGRGG